MQPADIDTQDQTTQPAGDHSISGRAIGKEVIKALKLEGQRVRRVQLDIPHDGPVRLVVTRLATEQETLALLSTIDHYNLTESSDGHD